MVPTAMSDQRIRLVVYSVLGVLVLQVTATCIGGFILAYLEAT